MPMLDITIPEGALSQEAESLLLRRVTDALLQHEGADPRHPIARSIAWVYVHRPALVFVGGEPASPPRYRAVVSVPEGQLDDERRSAMVAAVTDAILDAEAGRYTRDPNRVWVFTNEIPDGTWGGGGKIHRLADIVGMVLGDGEKGRAYAEERLARSRSRSAR